MINSIKKLFFLLVFVLSNSFCPTHASTARNPTLGAITFGLLAGLHEVHLASKKINTKKKKNKKKIIDTPENNGATLAEIYKEINRSHFVLKITTGTVLGGLLGLLSNQCMNEEITKERKKTTLRKTSPPTSSTISVPQKPKISSKTIPTTISSKIKGTEITLDQWWKKGNKKGAFVMTYYIENGKKYYILGNERTGSGWAPFGGKCDRGETCLQSAAREFKEESGIALDLGNIQKTLNATAPTDRFAVRTNSPSSPTSDQMIFYFVEWNKDDIINSFGKHDTEMTAFGIIAEDDLQRILSELNKEKSKNKSFDTDAYLLKQTNIVKTLKGKITKDGLRGLMSYLRIYIQNPASAKIPTFASGEKYFDMSLE
jgi:8-oxo-dGTP pyrophosphatase MutT (NUDIX family)